MIKNMSGAARYGARVYAVINTVEYNNDNKWAIATCRFKELPDLGFDEVEVERIEGLNVGGVLADFDYEGVMVIRIA